MKKTIKILLVLCSFAVIVSGACYAGYAIDSSRSQTDHASAPQKFQNPMPPDAQNLEMLGLEPFVSQLPVVMIDTGDQQILKEEKRWVKIAIFDDPSGENDIYGDPAAVLTAQLNLRGASSYATFDKPQYRLEFFKDNQKKKRSYNFLGMGEHSKWILNGPYLDRSLMRNYLMYSLSAESMEWAPECRFCEVFVDGRYEGVYLAVEPVSVGATRLRLSRFGLLSGATPYVLVRDRIGTEASVIESYGNRKGYAYNELSVRYPTAKRLTERQKNWIEKDISAFEQALYSDDFDDPLRGYAQYIDMDSFAEYYILNEFAMIHDANLLSTYLYKELGGKLQLCVWDFNNGFDNSLLNRNIPCGISMIFHLRRRSNLCSFWTKNT